MTIPKNLQPPEYCPDALATDVGWINPANGELLVLVKNLRQQIATYNADLAQAAKNAEELTIAPESTTIVEPTETVEPPAVAEASVQPAPRKRGRPRKNPQ